MTQTRDHGGGIDAACARYGGARSDWLDLSTGINPVPYPIGDVPKADWTALPDSGALGELIAAARRFWSVPETAQIVAAPGASAIIARMPDLCGTGPAWIPGPTYNEHAAAFAARGGAQAIAKDPDAPVHVYVHPNNPDGRLTPESAIGERKLTIIDESFCDTSPNESHIASTAKPGVIVLKSFGKFWGLAGLRLGFAIGHPDTLTPTDGPSLSDLLGPWAVAGPAMTIGTRALSDTAWAEATRTSLDRAAARLDDLVTNRGATLVGGTPLFRLYEVDNVQDWHVRLCHGRVLSRIFPYSARWIRLGLPDPDRWDQLMDALQ